MSERDYIIEELGRIIDAALSLASKGKPVFPCGINKRPLTSHGFKDATTDPDAIREMFSRPGVAGIGVPTGPVSGLLVIDRDVKNGVDGIAACRELETDLGQLPETLQQRTGSGGDQLFFACPSGVGIPCSAGKVGPGIDIRSAGGYVVVPPSRNEAGAYIWLNRLQPAQLPQKWIDHLARKPRPEQPGPRPTFTASQSTRYAEKALKDECGILADTPEGQRHGQLFKSVAAIGGLIAGGELLEQEARAAILAAVASWGTGAEFEDKTLDTIEDALEKGMSEPRTAPDGESGWNPDAGQRAGGGAAEWPEFVPFDQRPPDLPRGILPGVIGQFVEAVADAIQAPRELPAFNALGVVALALQKKAVVRVKADYSEGVNLYAITASEPGERKSAVVEACKAPIVAWERQAQDQARDEIRDVLSERRTMEKVIEKARTKAANAKDAEARKQACREIAEMERELPDVPALPRMLADDCTTEAMAVLMNGNGESLGILEAEGGILDTWAGRYSSGVPNLDLILKGYGGEPVTVDRKGKDPITLRSPRLTVILTPQPSVLTAAGSNQAFMGRGLIGRCLLCMPRPLVGFRDSSKTMEPGIAQAWHTFVNGLLAIPTPEQPHEITLTQDAYSMWLDFAQEVETAQRPDGELEHVRAWASKSTGHVIRIAGLFHMEAGPDAISRPIDGQTMKRAMAFVAWAAIHAKFCFGHFGQDSGQDCAKRALDWIRRERLETVTERAIYRALRGKYPTMDLIRPGVAVLVDRGVLVPTDRQYKPGRPSTEFVVNPVIHGGERHAA